MCRFRVQPTPQYPQVVVTIFSACIMVPPIKPVPTGRVRCGGAVNGALNASGPLFRQGCGLYRCGGWEALDARKRGGRRPKLDARAIEWVYKTVTGGDPRQFKFPFALWTSAILRTVLRRELGIVLSRASICRLLKQLGLTAQRPLWRAYQQDPEAVNRFLEIEYPRLRKRAKAAGAEIWFADEAGVRSDAHAGTTWAPRGKTPVVSSTGARFGLNLISAVTRQGHFRFTCVSGRVSGPVFVEFLKRLLHDSAARVFLIVDRHPAHTAAVVKKFVASQGGKLTPVTK